MVSRRCAALSSFALFLLAGCGEQHFRAETVWRPDGRVERAVCQPAEFFPEPARNGWEAAHPAAEVQADAFTGSVRDLPNPGPDAPYLAAWGTFLGPEAIPDSLRFEGAAPEKAGRLERTTSVNRLGFVTEYVWRERLTDVVSLTDMQAARREAAGLVADLAEATLRDGTLRYDIAGLLHWLRTDAAVWFDELHETFLEAAIRHELNGDGNALAERLADVCQKHGLDFRDADGKLVESSAADDRLDSFLVAKVRDTVRTQTGESIDEETARQFLARLGVTWNGSSLSWQPTDEWRRAVAARFGSEEAAKARAAELLTRLLGVYNAGVLMPRRPVRYEMTVPGTVVETTGERTAENRVVWRFDASAAFPFGYDMTVRSLAPNEAAQKAVFGGLRLKSLDRLAEYAALVRDPTLAALVEKSIAAGSLKPLDDYAAEVTAKGDADAAFLSRLNRLRKLLAP